MSIADADGGLVNSAAVGVTYDDPTEEELRAAEEAAVTPEDPDTPDTPPDPEPEPDGA